MCGSRVNEGVSVDVAEFSREVKRLRAIMLEAKKGNGLSDALKLLRNQMTAGEALIFIDRYYFQLKLQEIEQIFRWHYSHISRIATKAERNLKIRG